MLSIAKINSAAHQIASGSADGKGYLHYLGGRTTRNRSDFDDYARSGKEAEGPLPFWACKGPALLGLDAIAEADQVERLAKGLHPITGAPLVKGSGDGHVMGLDMTFSAPKDFSAVFAGADASTREALIECLQQSARTALGYAETAAISRHGHGGQVKQTVEAAIAACYTHFASRALDPQLHVHAFMFNVGKRKHSQEWSALEHRPQFERKMATGILFRVELAARLKGLGFDVIPAGPFFTISGIDEHQRESLSKRSHEIAGYMQENAIDGLDAAVKGIAALNTRAGKAEPPLPQLLEIFEAMAAELGITPQSVASMRTQAAAAVAPTPFAIDHAAMLDELMADKSCATASEALTLICEKAMGRWNAAECLAELERFMEHEQVARLGYTELLAEVFTSQSTKDLEKRISDRVANGSQNAKHSVKRAAIDRQFDQLESDLRAKLGVPINLDQQRKAALHIACESGDHAFVEGWAGTGKTTMLKAIGTAYKGAGFKVLGCCQSAAATQNLSRETGIHSRTVASILLSLRQGKGTIDSKTIVVLDEAGMVGSREFDLLQSETAKAGAKLVCVGDPKQLQPIEAGGIFRSLMDIHGKAEISNIQRQRTDYEPLMAWLDQRADRNNGGITKAQVAALRAVPEDCRMQAVDDICSKDKLLSRAFAKWRARFDHEWLREAVELFAKGDAKQALGLIEAKKRLLLLPSVEQACDALISAWDQDKTAIDKKTMIAATRVEVAELNKLARLRLIERGDVRDSQGVDAEIIHRDDTTDIKRFAPGDRIVFTKNDRQLGVANGVAGRIESITCGFEPSMTVRLDDPNERGEHVVDVPLIFGRFDHAYCLTNHKSQGRTFDSAYVLANPSMADREWTYVATSRSRFATTLFVNASALGMAKPDIHAEPEAKASRQQAIDALAARMSRSRAKGTTLDYADAANPTDAPTPNESQLWALPRALTAFVNRIRSRQTQRLPMGLGD